MPRWVASPRLPSGPVTELRLAALAVVLAWAWWDASDSQKRLDSLGLIALAALALGAWAVGARSGSWDRGRIAMVACIGAFAAWSFLSMAWADFPSVAWAGSNRMLVYAALFALSACWPASERECRLLLGVVALGLGATGAVVALRLLLMSRTEGLFEGGRLTSPLGYSNGNAALFVVASIAALVLAASPESRFFLRSAFLASATLLTGLGVLTQSRAWLFTLPVALALVLLCVRRRLRMLLGLGIVAATSAPAVGRLNGLFDRFYNDRASFDSAVHRAAGLLLAVTLATAVLGLAWSALDSRVRLGPRARRVTAQAVIVALVVGAVAAGTGAAVEVKSPRDWITSRWDEFTGGYSGSVEGSRLTTGLGSSRYDIWKAAALEFADHPVIGIGSDNFAAQYLLRRESSRDNPYHPHSIPLRILSQLGIVGGVLFAGGVGLALWRGISRRRRGDPAAADVAGAWLAIFLYWLVQGSIDVLWEIPALGGLAFAALGLVASPATSAAEEAEHATAARELGRRRLLPLVTAGTVVVLAAGAVSLSLTGLSDAYADSASALPAARASRAYQLFGRAASLNPLAATPYIDEGLFALRIGDTGTARRAFTDAIDREPKNWFPYMELALVDGASGRYSSSAALLERAQALNPQDPLVEIARRIVAARSEIDPALFNKLYADHFQIAGMDWLIGQFFQIPPFTPS